MSDRGGEGEDALGDASTHPDDGATAVEFDVELTPQGLVDRFDHLPQWPEQPLPLVRLLALSVGRSMLIPSDARSASSY